MQIPTQLNHLQEAVKEQYEFYPYPLTSSIEEEDVFGDLNASFSFDLGLSETNKFKKDFKIWVPGCGTRWAVLAALQFRDAEIIGSDISKASLEFQKRLAQSLNLDNITFKDENLLEIDYENYFDYINIVGVLHHLPQPAKGFTVLKKSLKQNGVAEIMVYDKFNRYHSIWMQEILNCFNGQTELDPRSRFDLISSILISANEQVDFSKRLVAAVKAVDDNPSLAANLADFVSHPNEHYYSVSTLLKTLDEVNFSLLKWRNPEQFEPEGSVDNTELKLQFGKLSQRKKWELAHVLNHGILELFSTKGNSNTAASSVAISQFEIRPITHYKKYILNEDGSIKEAIKMKRIQKVGENYQIDGMERRPCVVAYGRPKTYMDYIVGGKRQLNKPIDPKLQGIFNSIAEDILALPPESFLVETFNQSIKQKYIHKNFAETDLLELVYLLLKTPNRIFAIVNQ